MRLLFLFITIAFFLTSPVHAAETQPGDSCTAGETDRHRTVGGPENPGAGLLLVCDGSTWNLVYEYDNAANLGIKKSDPKAPLHVGGETIIGISTGLPCDTDRAGGLRWSSADLTFEMCDGTDWRKIVAATGTGTPPASSPNPGYFVRSYGTTNGNIGGLTGSDSWCLTDLTNNDWMGKSDAQARGILVAAKVKAWLCNQSVCNNLNATQDYLFAVSGDPAAGGATLTIDSSGSGPGNTQNWSAYNYLGGGGQYWTGRGLGTSTDWGNVDGGGINSTCGSWTTSGTNTALAGVSNNTSTARWRTGTVLCSTALNLICIVHP